MKASAMFISLFVASSSLACVGAVQAKSVSTPAVALRGGLSAVPVNLARLDPNWWRATTPTTTAAPVFNASASTNATNATKAASGLGGSLFDTKIETCTPFLNVPGTFLANEEYWTNACKAVPAEATYVKLITGDVTDYFKPKATKSICDMFASQDQHMWSSDGTKWLAPDVSANGLGGSADNWLTKINLTKDKRDTPSFWGIKSPAVQTGGCCHSDYKAEGKAWAKPFRLEFCGTPQVLAPICTPLTSVAGSFSADKDFWAETCKTIPMTAGFVKVNMGSSLDYFRPPTGKSYCEMLTTSDQHKWSKDGETWVTPTYDTSGLGGSAADGVDTGDARTKVSFWGSSVAANTGGCCYASPTDSTPGFGKAFTLSYCEIATPTPVSQLVEELHSTESLVQELEKSIGSLHTRLAKAENVNVDAAGNVSLARSGMFKLAAKASGEADELNSFQKRASLLGVSLDQGEDQLKSSDFRILRAAQSAKATIEIAKKTASPKALQAQETLNDHMWQLMDPSNKDSLDATEKRVREMEKAANKFRKELSEEVKTVLVSKMRRSVNRLRKVIHRLGTAGNKASDGQLGDVDSSAPLGADLGLDDA